ncbi:hypothetical protein HMPREF0542_11512 [Ligilactobacillus ruminis ATCC 25644]|uniref:Uncharacterized protein n=1 Tax=Ligilactobacillus ruminis ATCC 25644 TaxID=525362 RepID=E7FRI5_9LACO|nr:hypothetical protein HMPREF0542_11512 [Ligilactobacillus ruminis ATCC 25644]
MGTPPFIFCYHYNINQSIIKLKFVQKLFRTCEQKTCFFLKFQISLAMLNLKIGGSIDG